MWFQTIKHIIICRFHGNENNFPLALGANYTIDCTNIGWNIRNFNVKNVFCLFCYVYV